MFQEESRKQTMAQPLVLILVSAVLYGLSFPPFSLSLLMWVALVPFFSVIVTVRPGTAAAYGMLWGMIMTCSFGWSFPQLVANYFRLPVVLGWGLLGVVSLVLFGIYYGVFAAWMAWCSQRRPLGPWLVAAGWGACEFARATIWVGNPLALAGYSQVPLTRLIQIADFSGPYGIGMLIVAVNAGIAGWLAPRLRGRHWRLSWIGIVGALVFTLGYGTWRLSQTFTSGELIHVALIQGAIPRKQRWQPSQWEANLAHYLDLTRQAAEAKPALIFWPENAVDFPLQRESTHQQAVLRASQDLGADLILGGPYFRFGVDDLYNRNAVFVVRNGKLRGRYDKLRLLPFAEQDWFGWLRPPDPLLYEPGRHLHNLRTTVARIGTFICFEALYPDFVRHFTQQGAQLLVNPSNDDWFGHPAPAQHLLNMTTLRAIENRRYLVRPTKTGFSAVIDPYGRVVAQSGFGSPEIVTATVVSSQAETLYQRWGDVVGWSAVVFALSVAALRINWRRNLERRYRMRMHNVLTGVVLVAFFGFPASIWAGGAGNGTPAVREAWFLPHICTAGPNTGLPCTVHWDGQADGEGVVSDDCPGACVIDYESDRFRGDFFVMVDEDTSIPKAAYVPVVTALLCVEKDGTSHCFTESYRPHNEDGFEFDSLALPLVMPEDDLISSTEDSVFGLPAGRRSMLRFWKFFSLNPDSDLPQALRDLYGKTGNVVVTDIRRIQTDDHTGDATGSVLRFHMIMRFVQPLLGP